MTSDTSLVVVAQRLGGAVWVEQRLFEVLGAWVPDEADDGVVEVLARISRHHAWRADQLATHLGIVGERTPDDLVAPPAGWVALVDAAASAASAGDRLRAVVQTLLPAVLVDLQHLVDSTTTVSSAGLARVVGIAIDDTEADRGAATVALERLEAAGGG